ncbi:hypothetical protein POVWA2_051460 [Plasmodium ovale wallikeri]|uniref:Uncharacterized protein n=1 Tax=Plasmodium ovale wallikeri TaxID=864142 RepID=A0A1A8YMP0_PLAOA|nr:hypothetical protein POVWA1_013730 [Plasmodium ovale wallikeri]SBT46191.1 hypothetical protein POVWA2_051460 [Plasmodium ovale wallikeri]
MPNEAESVKTTPCKLLINVSGEVLLPRISTSPCVLHRFMYHCLISAVCFFIYLFRCSHFAEATQISEE